MKIALLISGYLRGLKENIESIKNNVIQDNSCDVYIHITENYVNDKYVNKNILLDDINNIFKPKLLLLSKNLFFSDNEKINNLLNQNYKFYWLNEERKKICQIEKINYDVVVKLRPDLNIKDKLNYNIDFNYLYIPNDSKMDKSRLLSLNDNFICDILAYGSSENMNGYFNYYLQINQLIKSYGSVNETLLYYYLNSNKINYTLVDIDYYIILSLCNTFAVTGDSGSGKTTISNILKELFNNSFVLECDRYHKWERNDDKWKNITHLNPDANYITKMSNDVFDLKIGNKIYQVDYDHEYGIFTNKQLIEPKENIIVCGLHSLYLSNNVINLKIYMDTDDNLRIPWKIKRDTQKRGYSIEKILTQIKSREDDFKKYIFPQKEKADIIINFYTDKEFDISHYNMDDNLNIYLRIGVSDVYNINDIIIELKDISQIKNENKFIYFYFNMLSDFNEYKNIIKTLLFNIKSN